MSQRTHKRWVIINIIRNIWLHFDLMLWIMSYRNRMKRRCLVQKWFRAYYCGIAATLFLTDLMNWQSTQSSADWTLIRDNSHVCAHLCYHGYQMILHLFRPIHGWILGLFTISRLIWNMLISRISHLKSCSWSTCFHTSSKPHHSPPGSGPRPTFSSFLGLVCSAPGLDWQLSHQLKRTALIGQTHFHVLAC